MDYPVVRYARAGPARELRWRDQDDSRRFGRRTALFLKSSGTDENAWQWTQNSCETLARVKPPPRLVRVFRTYLWEIVKDLNRRFWEHHIESRRGREMSKHSREHGGPNCPERQPGPRSKMVTSSE